METESTKKVKGLFHTWLFIFEEPAIKLFRTRSNDQINLAGMVETPIGIVNCQIRIQVFPRSDREHYLQVALKAVCKNRNVTEALGFNNGHIWEEGWLMGHIQGETFIMRKPLNLLP